MKLTLAQALDAIAEIQAETAEWTAKRFVIHTKCTDRNIVVRMYKLGLIERTPGHMYRAVPGAKLINTELLKVRILRQIEASGNATVKELSEALPALRSSVRLVIRAMLAAGEIHPEGNIGRAPIYALGPGDPTIKIKKPPKARKAKPKAVTPTRRDIASSWF